MAILNQMQIKIGAPLLILFSLFSLQEARAEFFYRGWTDHYRTRQVWDINVEGSLYTASQNLDAFGRPFSPQDLNSYQRIQMTGEMGYGLGNSLSAYGILNWGRVQISHTTLPGVSFGLGDQAAGLTYRLSSQEVLIDLQVEGSFPAYSNTAATSQGVPFLGDGSIDSTFGGFATFSLTKTSERSISLTAGGGYTYRTSLFSASLPWSAHVRLNQFKGGLWGAAGFEGVYSLQNDASTHTSTRYIGNAGNGGTYAVNAINPSIVNLRVKMGYHFSPEISLNAGVLQTVAGKNVPFGTSLFLGLEARFAQPVNSKNATQLSPAEYGKSNQGFVNYLGAGNEARVTSANDRLNMIKINQGSSAGIKVGQTFDIFSVKDGANPNEAVARAKVTSIKNSESVLTIQEYFREVWIDEGFIAKQPLQ